MSPRSSASASSHSPGKTQRAKAGRQARAKSRPEREQAPRRQRLARQGSPWAYSTTTPPRNKAKVEVTRRSSADFQSAVSPICNRLAPAASLGVELCAAPAASQLRQVAHLRYSRLKICATPQSASTVTKHPSRFSEPSLLFRAVSIVLAEPRASHQRLRPLIRNPQPAPPRLCAESRPNDESPNR